MKTNKMQWIAFGLGSLLALGLPFSAIWKQHRVAAEGELIKLLLRPYDPYDPFRGRYVWLAFEHTVAPAADPSVVLNWGDFAFLTLSIDELGFARPLALYKDAPPDSLYLRVKVLYQDSDSYSFSYPIDRFYLNEKDAPRAERLAMEAARVDDSESPSPEPSFVEARVLKGDCALMELFIGGRPLEELLAERTD